MDIKVQAHVKHPTLGGRFAEERVCRLCWRSGKQSATSLRRCTWLNRVPAAAHLTVQVPENPVDDSGISDERNDFHLGPTAAEEGIRLKNLLNEALPRCPAGFGELQGGIG